MAFSGVSPGSTWPLGTHQPLPRIRERRGGLRLRDKGNLGSLPRDGRKPRRRFEGDRLTLLVVDWRWRPLQPVSALDRTFGFQRPVGWGQRFYRRAPAKPR